MKDFISLALKPVEAVQDVDTVKLKVHSKDLVIHELLMVDELGNETTFSMSEISLDQDLDKDVFKEKIPAGAVVEKF